jgi:hypothetical protein
MLLPSALSCNASALADSALVVIRSTRFAFMG